VLPRNIETVVVSPDDDRVRRQVQLDLPRRVLNGGTNDDGIYVVSRHDFLNDACLACIARSDLVDRSPVAAAARRLGIAEEELAPHLDSSDSLPPSLLSRAATLTADDQEELSHVSGHDLLEHLYGTLRPTATGSAVSAPMLSSAPGVLLAAELVLLALGQPFQPSVTMTSILTGPHPRWTFTRKKSPRLRLHR